KEVKVCHISTAHPPDDIRIMKKEIQSLSKEYNVTYLLPWNNISKEDNFKYYTISKSKSRLGRMLIDNFKIYQAAKNIDASVYHFHDPEFLIYAYLLKLKGKTIIYDVHEDLPRSILSKTWINKRIRKAVS